VQYKLLLNYANMLFLTLCHYVAYFDISYVPVFRLCWIHVFLYDWCKTGLFRCV